jgi:hypothetical protein
VAQACDADGNPCHTVNIAGTGQRVATLCHHLGNERARYAHMFANAPEAFEVLEAMSAYLESMCRDSYGRTVDTALEDWRAADPDSYSIWARARSVITTARGAK